MKLLASDYDGTYYINDQDIEINNNLINDFMKDNIFVIVTGRTYPDFIKVENKYNIKYNYLIINHGSSIISNNKIIYNKKITNKLKKILLQELELNNSVEYFGSKDKLNNISIYEDDLNKIYIKYNNTQITDKIYNVLINKYNKDLNIYKVGADDALEIVSFDSNKKDAIKYIVNKLNINKKNVYTIGDNYTDIKMVKEFNGFTMIKSIEEIKEYAIKEYNSLSELIIEINDNQV